METCPICFAHWTTGTKHNTEPKVAKAQSYAWGDPETESFWQEDDWGFGHAGSGWKSRSSSRHQTANAPLTPREQSAGANRGRGRGKSKKGKGKGNSQNVAAAASPFVPQSGKGFTAWPTMDSTSFMPSNANLTSPFQIVQMDAGQQEMAAALRRAYPDPSKVPDDVQAMLDRAEKESGRLGLKNLHQAAKHLDRAKKQLKEVTDQRKAHRTMWIQHLTEGIKMWDNQLDSYRRHQAALTELASKAQKEVTSTSRIIQLLGAAGTSSSAAPITPPEPAEVTETVEEGANPEEEQLRLALQTVLKACANSLGLQPEAQQETPAVEIPSDGDAKEMEDEQNKKRPRSLEPFGGPRP